MASFVDPQDASCLGAAAAAAVTFKSCRPLSTVPSRRPVFVFLDWFRLFVEALSFSDLETLIAAQQTCRAVALLMAQHHTFRNFFFDRLQPFPRWLHTRRYGETKEGKEMMVPCFTDSEEQGIKSIPGVTDSFLFAPAHVGRRTRAARRDDCNDDDDDDDDENGNADAGLGEKSANLWLKASVTSPQAQKLLLLPTECSIEDKSNDNESSGTSITSVPRCHSSWKIISSNFQRQCDGVRCLVRTPEYFRGVWRLHERDIWRRPHLAVVYSPPFLLTPKMRRTRLFNLRQQAVPSVAQQSFSIVLQRTSQADGNALGIFIQAAGGPIEGRNIDVLYTLATLDRSLVPPIFVSSGSSGRSGSSRHAHPQKLQRAGEYAKIERKCEHGKLSATRANSGYIWSTNQITLAEPDAAAPGAVAADVASGDHAMGRNSAEDIVIEVEIFSLGPGIIEPDDVISYPEEIARVLEIGRERRRQHDSSVHCSSSPSSSSSSCFGSRRGPSAAICNRIYSMLRNLSHTNPYSVGVQALRNTALKRLIGGIVEDIVAVAHDENVFDHGDEALAELSNVAGVFWNLSDTDHPAVTRGESMQIVDALYALLRRMFDAQRADIDTLPPVESGNDNNNNNDDPDAHNRLERRRQRQHDIDEALRFRVLFTGIGAQFIGCLWNLPVSVERCLALFSCKNNNIRSSGKSTGEKRKTGVQFLHLLLDVVERESNTRDTFTDAAAPFRNRPSVPCLCSALHLLTTVRIRLGDGVKWITQLFDERDAERLMLCGVEVLRRHTHVMVDLGVNMYPRDFATFYLRTLVSARSSLAMIAFASFMFDSAYVLPSSIESM